MDLYLDANATTPVLPAARAAALAAMTEDFGNPSSAHSTGLRARALMDGVRAQAARVLGADGGRVLFVSGATEGIQTAVLSALMALRDAPVRPDLLLYGATEHKAVSEALRHWNALLGLHLQVQAIPVGRDGRHDLGWLRAHAPRAGLVCTMAANNETGVISDLDGIAAALAGSPALWLVDGVQALGKLPLRLAERRIDYAPFSGHKLYAPKGIGLLYVREGAPFTPLLAGGGQEGAWRSGTENMAGIAALGAVLAAIEAGHTFHAAATLQAYRDQLAAALLQAFPGLVFNAPPAVCLPTTLNFSVPGVTSRLLLDLFDAAGLRVSGGSACSATQAGPSFVLAAMGLPDWQASASLRLSFGPCADAAFIDEACVRIRRCGDALRASCLAPRASEDGALPAGGLTRFVTRGACCYVLADAASRCAVVIDARPALVEPLAQWLRCRGLVLTAVLGTHGDAMPAAAALRAALQQPAGDVDSLGWPRAAQALALGRQRLTRLPLSGPTAESAAYLLHDGPALCLAFVGDALRPGAPGRSDFELGAAPALTASLRQAVGPHTLLLPAHDEDNRFGTTWAIEGAARLPLPGAWADSGCAAPAVELDPAGLHRLAAGQPGLRLVDVREPCEQWLGAAPDLDGDVQREAVALSRLPEALVRWLALPADAPVVFFCRSGNRSAQAARALRRLGHAQAWSLRGGLALWPRAEAMGTDAALAI